MVSNDMLALRNKLRNKEDSFSQIMLNELKTIPPNIRLNCTVILLVKFKK